MIVYYKDQNPINLKKIEVIIKNDIANNDYFHIMFYFNIESPGHAWEFENEEKRDEVYALLLKKHAHNLEGEI